MISVCMIVKNEERVLEKCLKSIKVHLKNIVDDIVVVDTGSTDNTLKIVEEFGCRLFHFEWCNDFSKARNFSVSKAKNNWVMVIDADEVVENLLKEELLAIQTKEYEALLCLVKIKDYDDNDNLMGITDTPRIFNKKHYEYKNNIHEQLTPKNNKQLVQYVLNMEIKHNGYSESVMQDKNKAERNKIMLIEFLKEHPNNFYMKAQLGISYLQEDKMQEAIECLEEYVFNATYINTDMYTHFVIAYLNALVTIEAYEAVVVCENLWNYCSSNDRYVYLMAIGYIKTNRYEKAINALLVCVNWEGAHFVDKKQSYYLLGQIFEIFDEKEEAIKCFSNSIGFADSESRLNSLKEATEKL